jgi:SNF2 family DNA or RNA helicase
LRPPPWLLPWRCLSRFQRRRSSICRRSRSLDVADISVEFTFDQSGFPDGWTPRDVAPAADVALRLRYAELRLQKGFDELLSLGAIHDIEHFGYQLDTVRRVLRDFRGRVLLADEVGLGKTIEACLTLKEYWMRGLARKALILTPPSLVGQWVDELTERFALTPVAADAQLVRRDEEFWTREPLVVASLPLARQAGLRDRLSSIEYDLVVVDEAHALKNRASAGWQLVNGLKKRFLLLLSATPVGNDLTELYNLIQLLRPGLLQSEAQFRREYGQITALSQAGRRDRRRELLRAVMVRNTRAHIDLKLPKRLAATHVVRPAPEEGQVLDALAAVIRDRYHTATAAERWRMTTLQPLGSTPRRDPRRASNRGSTRRHSARIRTRPEPRNGQLNRGRHRGVQQIRSPAGLSTALDTSGRRRLS